MTESFLGKEDLGLTDRLLKELPSVLNWAIRGWKRLNDRGYFEQPSSSDELIAEFEELGSPIHAFIRDCCELEPNATIDCEDLYREWRFWCISNGRDFPGTQQTFGRDLRAAIPTLLTKQKRRRGKQIRAYSGITLNADI